MGYSYPFIQLFLYTVSHMDLNLPVSVILRASIILNQGFIQFQFMWSFFVIPYAFKKPFLFFIKGLNQCFKPIHLLTFLHGLKRRSDIFKVYCKTSFKSSNHICGIPPKTNVNFFHVWTFYWNLVSLVATPWK